ncbi:MAG TPA: sugar phosphate isomerase/epimerase [Humisphaera sp.]|nr:sugar phosphate isomerase/epimerase [Humisphaera sp.]
MRFADRFFPRIAIALLLAIFSAVQRSSANPPPSNIPDEYKINGFAVGCQAYTFRLFTVMEAIEKTSQAGGKVIEFYPGQKLRADQPAVTFSHTSPDAVIEQVKEQLRKFHIKPVNYGVVSAGGNTPQARQEDWKKIFAFAKKMDLVCVTSEPNVADMDFIESLVKENNIRFAIHDHPRQPWNPSYQFWDPAYVLSLVKNRDSRMGSCADIGHWVRSGVKPLEALKLLEGRVMSSHMKDLTEFGNPNAYDIPWGTGVSGVGELLDELKRQGFDGNISIEYEHNEQNSLPEVTKCVDFVKNYKPGAGS